ncbi:DUF1566 domain-containing protein [Vibrio cholerae]|uniref:Lcl C-terminal domain-containing protein n=1 Tax=Vibrio cholerae TaxID=666 RepID=UPI003015FE6E
MMKKLFLPLAALTITACQPEPNVALRIDCGEFNDQGVAITLNGTPIGDCPLDIMTHAGQADISVKKTFADASYLEGTQSVMLAENVNKRVKFELQQIYGENYYYKKITTIADAREYLKRFPQGQYAQQVSEKLEDWFYEKTTDLSGMNEYLKLYPEGRYAPQVAEKKELRYYEGATDISGIEDYIKNYPQGKFISVVKDRQEEYYANKAKTPEGIKDYKERYPEGKFISLMPERLEDYYYSKVISVVSATKYMELYPNGRYYKEVSDKRESLRLINKRYFDNLDGTVTDKKTGLVWMRCTYGQKWNGENCTGNAKKLNWSEANSTANKTQFAGKQDWRLPTKEELNSIIYCSKGSKETTRYAFQIIVGETDGQCAGKNYQKPTIDLAVFPNTMKDSYWSKSEDSSNAAWYLYFGYAFDSTVRKSDHLAFRLVSGGTKKTPPKNNISKEVARKSSEKIAKVNLGSDEKVETKKEDDKKEASSKIEDIIFEAGQEWTGHYYCAQGKTALSVIIDSISDSDVNARFIFDYNNGGAKGSYSLLGKSKRSDKYMDFEPVAWIERPSNYGMVGLSGQISSNGRTFSGKITSSSCGSFNLDLKK